MQRRKKEQEKGTLFRLTFLEKKNEKDVEVLTNNQLKLYLKQHGLEISGSKANAARDVLEDEEVLNNSSEDTST